MLIHILYLCLSVCICVCVSVDLLSDLAGERQLLEGFTDS